MGGRETVRLPLADRVRLEEDGELDDDNDELENALTVRPLQLLPSLLCLDSLGQGETVI